MTTYKNCQSCIKPLKKDPEGGGTEANGSKSLMYCSFCYTNGQFNHPEINTAQKMQAYVKGVLKKMGFPGIIARLITNRIPSLERWKSGDNIQSSN